MNFVSFYLSIQATSNSAERIRSSAKFVYSDLRPNISSIKGEFLI